MRVFSKTTLYNMWLSYKVLSKNDIGGRFLEKPKSFKKESVLICFTKLREREDLLFFSIFPFRGLSCKGKTQNSHSLSPIWLFTVHLVLITRVALSGKLVFKFVERYTKINLHFSRFWAEEITYKKGNFKNFVNL